MSETSDKFSIHREKRLKELHQELQEEIKQLKKRIKDLERERHVISIT